MGLVRKCAGAVCLLGIMTGLLFLGQQEGKLTADKEMQQAVTPEAKEAAGEGKSAEEEVKKIAITFDDGPHPKYTAELLDGLKEPVESREIRLNVIAEDFAPAARQLIERLMEYATEHEEWHIAPDNREGVRISFDIDSHLNAAWFLLRLSVHDPVMPLNAESDVPGGVRYVLQKLYEAIQDETDVVDLSPLRAALQ